MSPLCRRTPSAQVFAAALDVAIAEVHHLLVVIFPSQHDDVVERSVGGGTARKTQSLHHVDRRCELKIARLIDLAEHVDMVTADLLDGDRHDRLRHIALQALGDFLAQILDRFTAGRDVPRKRKMTGRRRAAQRHRP